MKRPLALICLAVAGVALAGCDDGYVYGVGAGWGPGPYAYDGWYDGYYGPIYDGYWGTDGYFYYRLNGQEHGYRRGGAGHFQRQQPPQGHFQPWHGAPQPSPGVHMPHFEGAGRARH